VTGIGGVFMRSAGHGGNRPLRMGNRPGRQPVRALGARRGSTAQAL